MKVSSPKIRSDWGITEFSWRTGGLKVVLTERDGVPIYVAWGSGLHKRDASLPASDNMWMPPQVLFCLDSYREQARPQMSGLSEGEL